MTTTEGRARENICEGARLGLTGLGAASLEADVGITPVPDFDTWAEALAANANNRITDSPRFIPVSYS
jgi:hypothetical protein